MTWIDVNKELPDRTENVLVNTKNGVMCYTHNYNPTDNNWFGYGQSWPTHFVTHWMPLPDKPPK